MKARLALVNNVFHGTRCEWSSSLRPARINFNSASLTAGCSSGRSRNHRRHHTHHNAPAAPHSTKAHRQLCICNSVKTNGAVIADPTDRPTNETLIARPCSRSGNQRETARAMFGKAPASPAPKRNRMTSSDLKPEAAPVKAVNADHHNTTRVKANRAPNRSPSHPLGISNAAYANVNALKTQPF